MSTEHHARASGPTRVDQIGDVASRHPVLDADSSSGDRSAGSEPADWDIDETVQETEDRNPEDARPDRPLSGGLAPATPRRSSMSDREHIAVLVCSDFIMAAISLPIGLLILAAFSLVHQNNLAHFRQNLTTDALFPVFVVLALAAGGSYRSARRALQPSAFTDLKDLIFAIGAGCVLTLAVGSFLHGTMGLEEPHPTQLVVAVMVGVVLVSVGRAVIRAVLHALAEIRVIIVGAGTTVHRIATYLQLQGGMAIVGTVVDEPDTLPGTLGTVRDLPELCSALDIDRVIIGFPDHVSSESVNIYRSLQHQVHIAFLPRYYQLVSWRSQLTDASGLPLLEVAAPHLSAWDRGLKRAFDLVLGGLTLLLVSPVLAVVALVVRLTSPGPILFRQERVGRNQEIFTIFKFRTMTVETEDERAARLAATEPEVEQDDPVPLHLVRGKLDEQYRLTRFGGIMRRLSLDELPQLFNVIRGDMSIVGPRPFVPHESPIGSWGARRFEVRPGITGLWQVSGRNDLSLEDLGHLDSLYVASWSLWWDLKILWDTPRAVLRGYGAY